MRSNWAPQPIREYYAFWPRLNVSMKVYTPYTYASFKTFIPKKEKSDFYELATKVKDLISLRIFFYLCGYFIHPAIHLIPVIPLVLDGARLIFRKTNPNLSEEQRQNANKYLALAFIVLGIATTVILERTIPKFANKKIVEPFLAQSTENLS